MRKFFILLFKEIKELLTPQMILPFILVVGLLYFFGNFANEQAKKERGPQPIVVADLDHSPLSKSLVELLAKSNFKVSEAGTNDELITKMKNDRVLLGLSIPTGFQNSVEKFEPQKIQTYSYVPTFSITAATKYAGLSQAVAVINEQISNQYIAVKTGANPSLLKNPIQPTTYMIVKDKVAEANPMAVLTYLGTQAYFVPIVLFLIIIFASQMIATSIASEKENKTLETLLTAPINRKLLVTAKMIAAAIVGLIMAGFYLLGFKSLINGQTMGAATSTENLSSTLQSLGLVLSPQSYILLGVVVFLGILVALSIAIILGAFAEDVKSVQGVIAPLMVLLMIPYFAVLLLDVNALPTVVRYIVFAIPFSHIFMAMPNLYLHNAPAVVYGALYELVAFIIFVWLAAWIFSTDKIVTMKLNFSKKKEIK